MKAALLSRSLSVRHLVLFGILAALPVPTAYGQGLSDLLGSGSSSSPSAPASGDASLRLGKDRVDLGLPPSLAPLASPNQKSVDFQAQADLRMICSQFDLKASLQNLLRREAREEFLSGILDSLVHEVVGSGMELLCQAEPTACTLLQGYSVSAHAKLGYYKDLCQAVESAVTDAARKSAASTVDQCLKAQKDQGASVDRAIEACRNRPPQITGFHGEVLAQLDLGNELSSLLQSMGLSPGATQIAQSLGDGTQVRTTSVGTQADPAGLTRLYDQARQGYAARLGALVDQAAQKQPIATADLVAAVPSGAPPLASDEIQSLALLRPEDRAAALGSLSSALALFEMGGEIHEVERAIEVVKSAPTVDLPNRKRLEDRLARLRMEKVRLEEHLKDQALLIETYGAVRKLVDREYARRVSDYQVQAGAADRAKELLDSTRPYGALPSTSSSRPSAGSSATRAAGSSANCPGCGLEFSLGSVGNGP
jgi:hypothetical protein